jgi:hypothetical protein
MWKKINESGEEISEDEIISDFEVVYQKLENIQNRLNKSTNIELREKYMRHIVDFMNWLDYEI